MNDANRPSVGLTMGAPAGIGPEVIVKGHRESVAHANTVVIGDADVVRTGVDVCALDIDVRTVDNPVNGTTDPDTIDVLNLDNVATAALERGIVEAVEVAPEMATVER